MWWVHRRRTADLFGSVCGLIQSFKFSSPVLINQHSKTARDRSQLNHAFATLFTVSKEISVWLVARSYWWGVWTHYLAPACSLACSDEMWELTEAVVPSSRGKQSTRRRDPLKEIWKSRIQAGLTNGPVGTCRCWSLVFCMGRAPDYMVANIMMCL